jgi:hypothetical protein
MLQLHINPIFLPLLGLEPNWRLTDEIEKFKWRIVTSPPDPKIHPYHDTRSIYGMLIAFPSVSEREYWNSKGEKHTVRIYCLCTFHRDFIKVEYLFPAGETTLAFEMYLPEKRSQMLWQMFVPWAPFMSKNYTRCAFSLEKTLRMLKIVSHMMQKEYDLKLELHKELQTLHHVKE